MLLFETIDFPDSVYEFDLVTSIKINKGAFRIYGMVRFTERALNSKLEERGFDS